MENRDSRHVRRTHNPRPLDVFSSSRLDSVLSFFTVTSIIIFLYDFEIRPVLSLFIVFIATLSLIPSAHIQAIATDEVVNRVPRDIFGLKLAPSNLFDAVFVIIAITREERSLLVSFAVGCFVRDGLLASAIALLAGQSQQQEDLSRPNHSQALSAIMGPLFVALIIVLFVNKESAASDMLPLSHGLSILFITLYVLLLIYQLLYQCFSDRKPSDAEARSMAEPSASIVCNGIEMGALSPRPNASSGTRTTQAQSSNPATPTESTLRGHEIAFWLIAGALASLSIIVDAWLLVSNIASVVEVAKISKETIGFCLLPIISLAAERITIIRAVREVKAGRRTEAMNAYIMSSLRRLLVWFPTAVLISWVKQLGLSLIVSRLHAFLLVVTLFSIFGRSVAFSDGLHQHMHIIASFQLLVYLVLVTLYAMLHSHREGGGPTHR